MTRFFSLLGTILFLGSSVSLAAESVVISDGHGAELPRQPQIVIDGERVIHATFGKGKSVFYCQSTDRAKSFSSPVQLPGYEVLALGMRRGPRIAATKGTLCISHIGGPEGKGSNGDLLTFTSADGGKSWKGPVIVNEVAHSAREGLHAMAAGPKGAVCCAWLDLRNKDTEIMASVSNDGGKTWRSNQLVYRSPDGSVCECCHPSVAYGPDGQLHVMWRNSLGGNRDMYAASSKDGGKTFSGATKLGNVTWELDACPMDGGCIGVSPNGSVATSWRRDKDIFLTSAKVPRGQLIGPGRQPWITATSKGEYVVWVSSKGGELMLLSPGHDQPTRLGAGADDPVIATGPQGKGMVVAAWESRSHGNGSVLCQVVSEDK